VAAAVAGEEEEAAVAEAAAGEEEEAAVAEDDTLEWIEDEFQEETKTDTDRKTGPETLAEKLKGNKHYIYESLAEKSQKQDISSKIKSKPISNIADAIGVNDKFRLIKDLFKGDTDSYNKTINTLNEASDFNEAFTFINTNFEWDMEDESVQFLLELVRRKFIVNKDE